MFQATALRREQDPSKTDCSCSRIPRPAVRRCSSDTGSKPTQIAPRASSSPWRRSPRVRGRRNRRRRRSAERGARRESSTGTWRNPIRTRGRSFSTSSQGEVSEKEWQKGHQRRRGVPSHKASCPFDQSNDFLVRVTLPLYERANRE